MEDFFIVTKKTGLFDVDVLLDLENTFSQKKKKVSHNSITVEQALSIVMKQMQINNYRSRTIKDYQLYFTNFATSQNITYVDEIDADKIYAWLSSMDVGAVTKQNRLKCLKAMLTRFRYNGWIVSEFYKNIVIKVDKKVNKGANPHDLAILISLIDTTRFIGFRDVVAILTLYKTGIRSTTLSYLEERHIDFDNLMLNLDANIMKGRTFLKLPIDEMLAEYFKKLIEMNRKIRKRYKEDNNYIFITQKGKCIKQDETSNAITKQLYKYGQKYGLKHINAHAIRKAYAKRLLEQGASVALISKALGHADLEVTTRYLNLDVNEVAENLRDYL